MFLSINQKNDGVFPTPCIVDRSERAGTLDAMLTSPKPVSRLLRQSCSDWLLRQAADLRACAATSLLQPSRSLNSHRRHGRREWSPFAVALPRVKRLLYALTRLPSGCSSVDESKHRIAPAD